MGRRRGATITVITLVAALMGAVACEQALSIDGTITVTPRDACGLPASAGSCQTCVASKCCSQASACAADSNCAAYESCLLDCGSDYTCRDQCAIDHPTGASARVPLLDQCVASACNDACGMTCGLTIVPTPPDAAPTCASCLGSRVCTQARACGTSLQCETLAQCLAGCSAIDCHETCLALDDGGIFTGVEVATATECLKPCGIGTFWACAGNVAWPELAPGDQAPTLTLTDSTTGQGVAGASVTACGLSDRSCATPVGEGTSDAAGQVTLALPAQTNLRLGFQGYFDVKAPGDVEELFFLTSPLTVAHARIALTLLSQVGFTDQTSSVGVTLDPTRGQIAVEAVDCLFTPASDVVFTAQGTDAQSKLVYLAGGSFLASATSTDITGFAFLLNVPVGTVTLEATPKSLGSVSSKVNVFTRAGVLTSVLALPTP